jgi:Xaa-Pro aminopeptidase
MKKAQLITDAAFEHILGIMKPGVCERDIALEIEYFMKKSGASGPSFDLITVSGENTSLPHGVAGSRCLREGDFVTLDIGDVVDGYCSDMTRTVAVGRISDEQKKVYDIVLEAQIAAENALCAGKVCSSIDKIARDIISDAGYGDCFGHGLGHSVGLLIHEEPRLSPSCHTVLEEGMTITVEPGIYLEGSFGVRIEDMAMITKDGCMVFTKSPKELITL